MGKEWDSPKAWRDDANRQEKKRDREIELGYSKKIYGSVDERSPSFYNLKTHHLFAYQQWTTTWATEALRVLKPGGSMLVFGGDRTHHRMMCGIEDAGFVIKTSIMWLYGQGFPKAQDLGKILDKRAGAEREVTGEVATRHGGGKHSENINQLNPEWIETPVTLPATDLARYWDGYKIGGIKPAFEIIAWAVKPPEGTWTDNVLRYGTGAVNVGETRISHDEPLESLARSSQGFTSKGEAYHNDPKYKISCEGGNPKGRFPANLILSHHADCDGECHPECPVRLLDEQSGVSSGGRFTLSGYRADRDNPVYGVPNNIRLSPDNYGDTGGASRFFYCAKVTNRDPYNDHPTLKPTPVIEWLIRLVTRLGQTVLDPFAGSGTTGVAAVQSGREYILIEQDEHYCEIAEKRLSEVQMGFF